MAIDMKITEKVAAARDGAELCGGGGEGVLVVPGGDAGDSLEDAETEMESFCPWLQWLPTAQKK